MMPRVVMKFCNTESSVKEMPVFLQDWRLQVLEFGMCADANAVNFLIVELPVNENFGCLEG